MTDPLAPWAGARLSSPSGCSVEINSNGSLRRFDCGATSLLLFPGNEAEGGPANLYLRIRGDAAACTPLLGPLSKTCFAMSSDGSAFIGGGAFRGIAYSITLRLARSATAWFWHVSLENTAANEQVVDLTYAQDLALAPYGAVRTNEFYVSQYIDHTPLTDPAHGVMIASRQNQAATERNPWSLIGSLRTGTSFATDALQFYGFACRAGTRLPAFDVELPSRRLQHEHSMVVVRDAPIRLAARARATCGFFGLYCEHHPAATSTVDLERVSAVLALPEAETSFVDSSAQPPASPTSRFASAPALETIELSEDALRAQFPAPWRHVERDDDGALLSLFAGDDRHVVLRRKELRVLRPHGHILRTGLHISPDESALTSTSWMNGVFHSMLTQGHVSINRFLSTTHSYLGLFRSHGQRVFVEVGTTWRLLATPAVFEISPNACRWIYRHTGGEIQVQAAAGSDVHELTLAIEFTSGVPARCLISLHVALNGDDGNAPGPAQWRLDGNAIRVSAAGDSDVGRRFPDAGFEIAPMAGTGFEQIGGDELLFDDARSHQQPFVCVVTAPARRVGLTIRGNLVTDSEPAPLLVEGPNTLAPTLSLTADAGAPIPDALQRLAEIVPWYAHNAFVHYLAPRGLEQYSGGGWGTRDVCQGPVELLLALGRADGIRDILVRVMRQQNADGDWPQWFMFFERERTIRAEDSHGDVALWPLLALAQYLIVSGDAGLLDVRVPFFDASGPEAGEAATIWEHAQRALALIRNRVIPATALVAYGHGDWNDSLQPADARMRERLCSAWTVTLHAQVLTTLAHALREVGRAGEARPLEESAVAVKRDFQRYLIPDGLLTGYALFDDTAGVRYLLHPADDRTGVHYSSLAMIHAILEDMLTPEQAREHLRVIDAHLSGPDGVRLFDRPLPYHGGPQRLFQRAETATYFGREIGLMYMHAHLRFAQALAHLGEADRFFRALCQANPIGLRAIVPSATLRQVNCYYSSSDAAFDDRYHASEQYERVANGTVPLDGGWRIYSSGAGIALSLIMQVFLGLRVRHDALSFDPVIPTALDGLRVRTNVLGRDIEICYRVRSAGCGVTEIVLNDRALGFTTASNPYRRGAAVVAKADFASRLTGAGDVLTVSIG